MFPVNILPKFKMFVVLLQIFLVLAKYKGILYKMMNRDPKLLFRIFKVIYLKIIH